MTDCLVMATEKKISIPYVYHSTRIRVDTEVCKAYFEQYQNDIKDYVMPEMGKFSEDLKHPKWFGLLEYSLPDPAFAFLRYTVTRPLKLLVGKRCDPCEGLDGYVLQGYAFNYTLCLFRPWECLDPEYVHIKNPKADGGDNDEQILADLTAIWDMLNRI